ncbi:LOG family protein [Patescibacteria group bacterium]|nr:LOG family protein [Patescibacteria group bacterium]MBU1673790.1 LOG family protein [Patescibacteria group bacterium]MBU1963817.1 LOG family protein [Patescibacteria group bacterium]
MTFDKNTVYLKKEWTTKQSQGEISQGLELLEKINKPIIAFYGSAQTSDSDDFFIKAESLAKKLGEAGFAIITGGDAGITEAARRGAISAGADCIGLAVEGHSTQKLDAKQFTHVLKFKFYFAKRFIALIKSKALVYFPGGLGTMNELLENMMLIQNKAVDPVPLICVGEKFWSHLFDWLDDETLKGNYLKRGDIDQVKMLDDEDEIIKLIRNIK